MTDLDIFKQEMETFGNSRAFINAVLEMVSISEGVKDLVHLWVEAFNRKDSEDDRWCQMRSIEDDLQELLNEELYQRLFAY